MDKVNRIAYCITVCNEHEELDELLHVLTSNIDYRDVVIVQCDSESVTDDVLEVVDRYSAIYDMKSSPAFKWGYFPLNDDFAAYKNNLFGVVGDDVDWIFQIDADEMPSFGLIENLRGILTEATVDVILVPRINTVEGITEKHLREWRWRVDQLILEDETSVNAINFPDYQWRLYRNDPNKLKWVNKVHEKIDGFETYSRLPPKEQYALWHKKDIYRQMEQNQRYASMMINE